ncbi:MAG: hypothetical protein A2Y82_05470 [Candidatus Buchananbacteria bacterium RBG_13_36_9]|uniref:Uncharacterized protein n=1 Tax=Candidatus Buchananbacteria bacterium RBG_13_36_9 TaxID=1797530 RepID=A0A1G1XP97_9BACT|nr:MAG: hypothetical protein A2Y82_05470 [Candidatus Buchananbacteria bacterium RBG_13_36_9]
MKKTLIFILILVLLYCSLALFAFAQQPTNIESISSVNQVQALEKQIDLLNQMNIKILNTIYWALGGLITVFLAIVGLNFFQNFSLNKSRIEAIKDKMNNELKEELSKLQDQNKKNLESLNIKVESKIKSEVSSSLAQFKSKVDQLKDDYNDMRRESLIRRAFEHKSKKQLGYILNLTEVLELDIKKRWDFRISESLELISGCLDSAFTNSDSLTRLQKALNSLPPEYAVQKKLIEAKMKL